MGKPLQIRWSIVGPILLCLACSSNDDPGEGKGSLAAGGGGSSTGGSGGASGAVGFSNGGAAVACDTSADCVTSAYVSPIASQDDCYCLGCPQVPLNAVEDDTRGNAWDELCATWVPPNMDPCKYVKCQAPPESVCESGTCKLIN